MEAVIPVHHLAATCDVFLTSCLPRRRAVAANGYIASTATMNGAPYALPTNTVQFDEQALVPPRAPERGPHTEEVLKDAGLDWDVLMGHRETGAIL